MNGGSPPSLQHGRPARGSRWLPAQRSKRQGGGSCQVELESRLRKFVRSAHKGAASASSSAATARRICIKSPPRAQRSGSAAAEGRRLHSGLGRPRFKRRSSVPAPVVAHYWYEEQKP